MPGMLVRSDLKSDTVPIGPAFGCSLSDDGFGVAWVRVAGELGHAVALQLASTLSQATRLAPIVVVDLRGLTRVDSSGAGAIAGASRSARRNGRRLVVVRGGLPRVDRLLARADASGAVEVVELAAGEPLVLALLQIAHADRTTSLLARVGLDGAADKAVDAVNGKKQRCMN